MIRGLRVFCGAGVSSLAGIGFTVSLLIASLAFEGDPALEELSKTAVLVASLIAAVVASVLLSRRNAKYKRLRRENAGQIPGHVMQDPRKP